MISTSYSVPARHKDNELRSIGEYDVSIHTGGSTFFAVYSLLSTDIVEGDDDKPSIRSNRRKTQDLSKWDISTGPDRKSLPLRSRTCSAEGADLFANLRFALRFTSFACSQTFGLLSASLRSLVHKPSVCSPTRVYGPPLFATPPPPLSAPLRQPKNAP